MISAIHILLHNGFEENIGLVHAGDLISISEIKVLYYRLIDQNNKIKWNPSLFPFVQFNETDFLSIDFNNEQVYWTGVNENGSIHSYKTPYTSFSEFLSGLASDLKKGNGSMGEMLCC